MTSHGLDNSVSGLNWLGKLVCLLATACLCLLPARVFAAPEIPPGFRLIAQQTGVALYRKDYAGGTPDYVQIIDLTAGARIDLLYGDPAPAGNAHNQGMFGGTDPSFRQKAIRTYWDAYAAAQEDAFCVTNGQFFYMPESPTPLALPLLVNHQLLAEGFGYSQYPEKQLMLALWPDHADILPLTAENLASIDAEQVLGGLTEEANKKPKNAVGRTFVGLWDRDGDQLDETVAIYTTQTATQPEAARTVRSFGATKVMMLDGGGSTQLICQGQAYIDTTRAIPQALGISSGGQGRAVVAASQPPTAREPLTAAAEASAETVENAAAQVVEQTSDVQASSQATSEPTIAEPDPANEFGWLPEYPSPSGASASILSTSDLQNQQPTQTNGLDVLWLPVIIPPLSVLFFLVGRRQIFLLYREG